MALAPDGLELDVAVHHAKGECQVHLGRRRGVALFDPGVDTPVGRCLGGVVDRGRGGCLGGEPGVFTGMTTL